MRIGLRYCDNPFVDVGVAAITAFVNVAKPEQVTAEHLVQVADYLKDTYSSLKVVQGQLTTLFPNSGFTQPSFDLERKLAYSDELLYGFMPNAPKLDVACTFFPEKPAYLYAHRQFVPLLSADKTMNFLPEGTRNGVPMSGEAVLAVAAILLGAFRCKNWLIFHEITSRDDQGADMTLVLARDAWRQNRQMLELLRAEPDAKWSTLKRVKQVYVDRILSAQSKVNQRFAKLGDVTGYHFSNYGTNPQIEIVRLESSVWDFIGTAREDAQQAWNKFLAVGQMDKDYNQSYEALFDLPQRYGRFLRLLLKVADWNLTEIFLRKVVKMNQRRIQLLKDLGDRFLTYIDHYQRDGRGEVKLGFYYQFARASKPGELRKLILDACDMAYRKGGEVLLSMDEFILAFESPEDRFEGWTLARDLIVLRLLEGLPKLGVSSEERETAAEQHSLQDEAELTDAE